MTTENKLPQVYMIVIKDHLVSNYYKTMCLPSWEQQFECNIYDAVTPDILDKQGDEIPFAPRKWNGNGFSKTERACFYSHYNLWKKCLELDEPIIIVEHDANLIKDIDPDTFECYKMAVFCNSGHRHVKGVPTLKVLAGGAYYITPWVAQKLVDGVRSGKETNVNSDAHIIDRCRKFGAFLHDHAEIMNHRDVGVTIEHNGRGFESK